MISAATGGILIFGLGLLDLKEVRVTNRRAGSMFAPLLVAGFLCGLSRLLVTFAVVPAVGAPRPGPEGGT